MQNTKSEIIT